MRIRGPQRLVGFDAALLVERKARLLCQLAVRPDADRKENHIRSNGSSACQVNQNPILFPRKRADPIAEAKLYAVHVYVLVEHLRHFKVYGRHDLILGFDDRDVNSTLVEIFCHFQTDKTSSDDRRCPRMLCIDQIPNLIRVIHIPQRIDSFTVDAGNRRFQRGRAGGDDQIIIALLVPLPVSVPDLDGLSLSVDFHHFIFYSYIYVKLGPHRLGRLHQQRLSAFDYVADIIRQAAVGIRDIFSSFQHDDFHVFI